LPLPSQAADATPPGAVVLEVMDFLAGFQPSHASLY
jgi:hypothetical protein